MQCINLKGGRSLFFLNEAHVTMIKQREVGVLRFFFFFFVLFDMGVVCVFWGGAGLKGGGCLLPKKELEEKHLGHVGSSERGNILFFLFFSILGIILSPTLLVFTLAMK